MEDVRVRATRWSGVGKPWEGPVITPFVIAPDVIVDLIMANGQAGAEAALLFDAIGADREARRDHRRAYVAGITIPTIAYLAGTSAGPTYARGILLDLLRLVTVVQMNNTDYLEAVSFRSVHYDEALQFVACRAVGAKYLVTRNDYGLKRMPVQHRTAGEMMPLFRE